MDSSHSFPLHSERYSSEYMIGGPGPLGYPSIAVFSLFGDLSIEFLTSKVKTSSSEKANVYSFKMPAESYAKLSAADEIQLQATTVTMNANIHIWPYISY